MTSTTGLSYGTAPSQVIHADNGIDDAYREIGTGAVPLVLSQHFRGRGTDEVANTVLLLASELSSFTLGAVLPANRK